MQLAVLHAISGRAQDAFRSLGVVSTDVVWMASGDDEPILLLPYRERVGWKGKQRETLRGETPVRTGVSRVFPGQRISRFRAHNPKVAGSNPAPARKRTLGIPTFSRVLSRLKSVGRPRVKLCQTRSTRFDEP